MPPLGRADGAAAADSRALEGHGVGGPMARLVTVLALFLCVLAPTAAHAATPGELIGTYLAPRDDTVDAARAAITAARPGTPAAATAAGDARARFELLGTALRTTTGDGSRAAVDARITADTTVADALDALAAGANEAAAFDAALAEADDRHAQDTADATAGDGGFSGVDILQSVGGPTLLVGLVAFMSWRTARGRRDDAPTVARRRSRLTSR